MRLLGVVANGLLAASLLFVLVWWWVSVWLFVGGVLLYAVQWVWRDGVALPGLGKAAAGSPFAE